MIGFVSLIGAGCGTYDLITLRGLNALKKSDVVIYDALIDSALLGFAPSHAELICVGKRAGNHSAAQDTINQVLTEKALAGHRVARLKGGDPFVFGRGGEEIIALQENDIPFEIIPGITSAVAVPELAGIPVTHRKVSRSFHVITAHTADQTQDFSKYAQLDGTLVFLMGLSALPRITTDLLKGGMPADTSAAIISNGCTEDQKVLRSVLSQIAEDAKKAEIPPPAVIVVGETAVFDFSCNSDADILQGINITVTGTERFTEKIFGLLSGEEAHVQMYPHVRMIPKNQIPDLKYYHCIAFTSSYGAEIFLSHCRDYHIDFRSLAGIRIAAVGSGTYETLSCAGLIPDILPETYTVEALADEIVKQVPQGQKVLVLRAELGSDKLNEVFDRSGVIYDDIKIYDTVRNSLPVFHCDSEYIIFGSSFGVQSFFASGCTISAHTAIICIGQQTADAAKKHSDRRIIIASPHSAEGIINAIRGELQNETVSPTADK